MDTLPQDRSQVVRTVTRKTNDVSDITGAQVKQGALRLGVNRPHFHDSSDIIGSKSKLLHPKEWHRGYDLPQDKEIHGYRVSKFETSRACDPLQPMYKLPSFEQVPYPEFKFIRDSYNVRDIEGAFAKRRPLRERREREEERIAGSYSGWLSRFKQEMLTRPPRDILGVGDIIDKGYHSKRTTDIMEPIYTMNGFTNQHDPLMHSLGSRSEKNAPFLSLQTSDIEGAHRKLSRITNDQRRPRKTNDLEDIDGAQANTYHRCIQTQRRTDPNMPQYTALNGTPVDSSAVSVGKNIVFVDLASHLEHRWKQSNLREKTEHVTASVGNIGLLAQASGAGQGRAAHIDRDYRDTSKDLKLSKRMTFAKREAEKRHKEEVRMVHDLA